mgnify:CR=1 FL=1
MNQIYRSSIIERLFRYMPMGLLFVSVLNEFDFNNLGLKYFSFNFSYILIFYYSLKKAESFSYGLIFIAGLVNDVVVGTPLGISSLVYLLLCGAAAYLRNITLRPNLMKDWIFFLITILTINSILFFILYYIFNHEIIFFDQMINVIFTFLLYLVFTYLLSLFRKILMEKY